MIDGTGWSGTAGFKGNGEEEDAKEFLRPGGQHNALKRLDSDKEIKGNPSSFL